MKGNILYALLFASAVLLALMESFGIVSRASSTFLLPLTQDQEAIIDSLETRLARLQDNESIIIPIRQGFPYCEPFTSNIVEREHTVVGGLGGDPNDPNVHRATLTALPGQNNGVLQLTNLDNNSQLGYAFIDLPFSSTYGIKVSFEYFIYNGTIDPDTGKPAEPGDGISFFLYDGSISRDDFRIGGEGGSLGYSPHGYHSPMGVPGFTGVGGDLSNWNSEGEQGFGGLKGGYLGIGFDVWGNFGTEFQRRLGGFLRPDDYWATTPAGIAPNPRPRYPNSVVVRGPQIIRPDEYRRNGMPKFYSETGKIVPKYNSYQFITGKVTYRDAIIPPGEVAAGIGNLGAGDFVSEQFKLGSAGRVEDCDDDGYRKVFIDFSPIDPTNPSTGYQIKVDMLVNDGTRPDKPFNILNTIFTPEQKVPETLKLGFAGATGALKAFQEIRNVTVQVSNENQLTKPATEPLDATACIGSEDLFELDVRLNNIQAEIQCIQLYATEAEARAVSDQIEDISDDQTCESGICQIEVCSKERLIEKTDLGDFEAFLFLENNKEIPRVQFTSTSGAAGSVTIWYTVTDNFGQISVPKPITITINPFPKIDSSGSIIGPTCDGQNDGSISNVVLKDLISGYSFFWEDKNGNRLPSAQYSVSETKVGDYIEATIGVTGVNLGKYFLTVNNPATNEACDDTFEFEVEDVRGTPVEVVLDDQEICEGTPVIFDPELEDASDANNPRFIWWKDNTHSKRITDGMSEGGVTYSISAPGILTITGLPANASPYEYFVEVEADPSQNLCATPDGELKRVQVLVVPPLDLDATVVNDFCHVGVGSITVNASGGFGTYTYSLDGGAPQSSNVFSGLSPGIYTIEVSAGTNCIGEITREVEGAPELFIEEEDLIMPACDVSNGLWEVSFSGGTPGYILELFKDGTSIDREEDPTSPVVFDKLAPGNYRLRITDSNGCYRELERVLINDTGIPITVDPMQTEVCEGDPATILPVVNTTGNVSFKWYKDSGKSIEVAPSSTPDGSGLTYTIDPVTYELTVEGLDEGTYSYYLVAEGPGYCPDPPYKADIVVVPQITATVEVSDEKCFDANDGSLTVVASGADGNFEYSLNNGAFTSNPTFSGLAPGNYTVDIRSTGPNGCVFSTTAEVKSPPSPIVTNVPDILRSSCNLANGSIENLVISGGWGEYSVEWRRGSVDGSIVEGDDSGAKDLSPDTYFLLVTDKNGCVTTFDFEVTEQPQPNFAVNEIGVCEGEEVTFTPVNTVSGSSDTELIWYKDAEMKTEIKDGPDPADPSVIYSINPSNGHLTVSGLAGSFTPYCFYLHVACSDQVVKADAMVRIVPKPEFDTEPVTCFGESDGKIHVQSGGHANYRYSVDGGSPMTQAELAAASFPAKSYSIEVSNEGFCSDTFTVEVEGPAAALTVEPLSKVDPGCGANVGVIRTRITGGWQDYTVEVFKDGASMSTATVTGPDFEIKNLAPGEYYLSITDAEGCKVVSNTINLEYGPTAVEADDEVICEGEVAVFVPEALPVPTGATFEWYKDSNLTQQISTTNTPDSRGHTFEIASNGTLTVSGLVSSNSPISFYVIVTGGNSCPGFVKEVKATVNRMPVLVPEVIDEVCFGEKGTITLKGSAGDGTFEYSLDGNVFQSGNSFSVAPGTYTGYVRSGAGCVALVENIEVKGPTSPLTASLPIKEDATCNSTDGSLSLDLAGGYGNYVVVVNRNGQNYSSETAGEGRYSLTGLPAGTYSITVRDSGGCSVQVPAEVQIDNLLTPLTAQGDVICVGETATLVPSTTQTGISPIYTWFSNSDGTGQISSGTSGGVSYLLDSDGTLSIDGLEGRTEPYVFYVKISGQGVCEPPLMPVEVKVYPNMNLRVSNPSIVCDPNGTVDLTQFIEGFNPSVYDYQIYSPSGILMRLEDLDEVAISGYYQVNASYKGSNCWTSAKRIQVEIADELLLADFEYQADLGGGYFIPNGDAQLFEDVNFTDSSLGKAIIWNWDFGDGSSSSEQNPTHAYQKKGTYTVTLTTIDGIGCVSETQQVINVLDDYVVMVPTAFTPDGVKNQYFKPQFRGVSKMELYVFNTWGELIFHSSELETPGWDGTLNGKKVPNGNYVYRATFETRSGEKVERSGVFTLIR